MRPSNQQNMVPVLGNQIAVALAGVLPAIFFHLQRRGFLPASVLSCLTSGWAVTLILVFWSGLPWSLALLGGISWLPPFFLIAAVVGVPVRLMRKLVELRKNAGGGEGATGECGEKKLDGGGEGGTIS